MNSIWIERKLSIHPSKLDKNLISHIASKINEEKNKCDPNYGYIIDIDTTKIHIIDNIISNSEANVFFTIKFKAKIFKPKINNEYKGKVCIVFMHGILVDVMDKVKVLIPINKMGDYEFDKGIFKNKNKIITKDTEISIIINQIKYERQSFSCIGELNDK